MTILIFIFLRAGRNFSQLSGLITFHTLVSRFFASVAEISASVSHFCAYQQLFSHPKHLAEISANLQFLLCINITPYTPIKLLSSHSVNVLWYYYNCHARMGCATHCHCFVRTFSVLHFAGRNFGQSCLMWTPDSK